MVFGVCKKHKHPELFIKQLKGIFKKIIAVKIPDETNAHVNLFIYKKYG